MDQTSADKCAVIIEKLNKILEESDLELKEQLGVATIIMADILIGVKRALGMSTKEGIGSHWNSLIKAVEALEKVAEERENGITGKS